MKVCFDTDLIVRHGGRGPRYTPYPTALQFGEGLIELDQSGVIITQKGRLLPRSIAMVFDRYIDQAENDTRFSKAI